MIFVRCEVVQVICRWCWWHDELCEPLVWFALLVVVVAYTIKIAYHTIVQLVGHCWLWQFHCHKPKWEYCFISIGWDRHIFHDTIDGVMGMVTPTMGDVTKWDQSECLPIYTLDTWFRACMCFFGYSSHFFLSALQKEWERSNSTWKTLWLCFDQQDLLLLLCRAFPAGR